MRNMLASFLGVREVLFLVGLGCLTAGVWRAYGMDYGLIAGGAVLLFVAVRGVS